jgi:CRP/FNR family cyclic AMP-dependent transcriptional regulator
MMSQSAELHPADTVRIFQKQPDLKEFSAGQVIFSAGQSGDFMYGIIEGKVDMLVEGKVVETLETGDVFGEGALVHLGGIRTSTAVAQTPCRLAFLDRERFFFVVQETPMFAIEVMKSYSDRFRRIKQLVQLTCV